MHKTTDENTIAKIKELRAAGMKVADIAEKVGCSNATVSRWSREESPATTAEGGGEQEEQVDQSELVAWHEAREKELLEKLERVTDRLMRAMDTIEALQTAAAEG